MKLLNWFKTKKAFNTNFYYNKVTLFLPIIICGGVFALSIFLFAFGPYEWNLSNEFKLYSFLILCLLSLFLGYFFGTKKSIKNKSPKIDLNKLIYLSFGVSIIIYIFNLYATTGKLYPDILTGLFNSGYAYQISHNSIKNIYVYIVYFSILMSPITCFLIPITLLYFRSLNKYAKFLGVFMIILNLLMGISQGVINAYADISFKICLVLFLVLFSNIKNNTKKSSCKILLSILIIAASFVLYYKTVMSNRLLYDASKNPNIKSSISDSIKNQKTISDKEIDIAFNSSGGFSSATLKNKYFLSFLPDNIESSLNHLISYTTHGYNGLALAMNKKLTSSYGLGFSDFFRHNFLKIIGKTSSEKEVYNRTYMAKIEKTDNWVTGSVWSSFFIYPASDIGFPLTIILVGGIGYLFALLWKDLILNKNVFAGVLFYQFTIMICFFSANNQIFQGGATFVTVIFMITIWLITRFLKKEN